MNKNIIICSSCATNLVALCKNENIFFDGTFQCWPKLKKVFTIRVLNNGHYIPLVFCLLQNKSQGTYFDEFLHIRKPCKDITPKNFLIIYSPRGSIDETKK